MPPVYFQGKYNRYCKLNGAAGQSKFCSYKTRFYHLLTATVYLFPNYSLFCGGDNCANPHFAWLITNIATTRQSPLYCARIHYLISVNVQQAPMNINWGIFSPTWRNPVAHFCFVRIIMSGAIFREIAGKFNFDRHPVNICL